MNSSCFDNAAPPPGRRRRLLGGLATALALSGLQRVSAAAPRRLKAVVIEVTPFGWPGVDGKPAGLVAELTQQLARDSGLAIDNVLVPYPRAVAMLASGAADLMISLVNSELERSARQLGLMYREDILLIARKGLPLARLADLRGKTVGHLRRAEYSAILQAESGIVRYETSSYEQTLNMLGLGRIDAALGTGTALYYAMRMLSMPPEKLGPVLSLGKRDVALYYASKNYEPALAGQLQRGMEAMRQSGAVAQLRAKYGDAAEQTPR